MSEKPAESPQNKLFSVPVLALFVLTVAGIAYALSHRNPRPSPSADGALAPSTAAAAAPSFALHSGPPSPPLPNDPLYAHAVGAWCSYAGELPIYFCGKDQAACESAGPGSTCIAGGPTLWCLLKFDTHDSVDKADCYWTPTACQTEASAQAKANTLRTECREYSRT